MNEILRKFSRCSSYRKDTCYYDEYIAILYVSNKLEGRMTAFKHYRVYGILLLTKQFISYSLIKQFAYS